MIPANTDIETAVAEALEPFNEELEARPYRVYLDHNEVVRMAAYYRTDPANLHALSRQMSDWVRRDGGVDRRGLYYLSTLNPDSRWDWYEVGGRWDGYVPHSRCNCVVARTLAAAPYLKACLPYFLLTPDGQWLERERHYFGSDWKSVDKEEMSEAQWLSLVYEMLQRWPTYRVVCVDAHC